MNLDKSIYSEANISKKPALEPGSDYQRFTHRIIRF